MRNSLYGFFFLSAISAGLLLSGCGQNGASSVLGEGGSDGLSLAEREALKRKPFAVPSLADEPAESSDPVLPPSGSNASVILSTGFENESGACWNTRPASGFNKTGCGDFFNMSAAMRLSEGGVSHGGTKAMQVTFTKNEEVGGAYLAVNSDTVNVRSYYYFEPGFDFGQGMKIGRVSAHNPTTHMNDVDIILECRSAVGTNQCGVSAMRDIGVYFNGSPKGSDWGNISTTTTFQGGKWYAVEYQVIMNTPGASDGIVRLWIDGKLSAEKKGIRTRGTLGKQTRFTTVKIGGWYSNSLGGNSCPNPSAPSRFYVDDVVVAGNYVGLAR